MRGQSSPSLWSIGPTVLVTLWVLEDISRQVSGHPSTICLAPPIYLLLIVNYAACLSRSAPADTRQGADDAAPGRAWRWFVLPVSLVVMLSALAHPWPMTIRFSLSREAFERKAAEVLRDGVDQGPQRVGLYWVHGVSVEPDGYVRFVTGVSVSDPVGFAHDPSHPRSHAFNRHLVGNWYAAEW
jgi:hypothetical protein